MACLIAPIIDNQQSKLYLDIMKKVKNDRPLGNYLYAISLQLKNELTKKNTNDQGEMRSEDFFKRIQIDKLVSLKDQIDDLGHRYGFYEEDGTPITFDTLDDITDDIFNFNRQNEDFVAQIERVKDGFQVTVSVKNAENYYVNTQMEAWDAQWQAVLSYLHSAGFNIDFSNYSEYFNFFNIHSIEGVLERLFSSDDFKNLGPRMVQFILDTMSNSSQYSRLQGIFGDNVVNAIITHSYKDSSYHQSESTVVENITDNQHALIDGLLNDFAVKLSKIDYSELKQAMKDEKDRVVAENNENNIMDLTDEKTIRQALGSLYYNFHLNMDFNSIAEKNIKSISQMAKNFQKIAAVNLNIRLRKNEIKKRQLDRAINRFERQIEKGKYFESIGEYLEGLLERINDLQNEYKDVLTKIEELEEDEFDLGLINRAAKLLTDISYLYDCHYDSLKKLESKDFVTGEDLIEDDDTRATDEIKEKVSKTANAITNIFENFHGSEQKSKINLVYAFLKQQWGKDPKLLEDLIKNAQIDINVIDRYIDSIYNSTNPVLAVFGGWVRETHLRRDDRLRPIVAHIRGLDDKLNGHTKFMYVMNEKGIPTGKILSPYNYSKYEQDRKDFIKELRELKLDEYTFRQRLDDWENEHNITIKLGEDLYNKYGINIYDNVPDFENDESIPSIRVPFYEENGVNIYNSDDVSDLTGDQRDYYIAMAKLKAELIQHVPELAGNFYDAIQLSSDFINSVKNAGMNPSKIAEQMKQKFGNIFKQRVDDTEYGGIATVNGIRDDLVDASGNIVYRLPLFFTHQLEDPSRMSTDYSRGMMAMASAIINYDEMSQLFDILQLTKDYIASKEVQQNLGQKAVGMVIKTGKQTLDVNPATKKNSSTAGFMQDFWEANVIGRRKKAFVVGGVNVDKIADSLTRYTSVVGLSANILGAQANLLVGKVQMLIECGFGIPGGGEFMNMKDYRKAIAQYSYYLMPCLAEMMSNNKKSTMGVMMDFFDVSSDWFDKLKEQGFNSSLITKMLGNSSMFMLYGGGEHMLHAQTMFAILNHLKVQDPSGKTVPLFQALEVKVENNNGTLVAKEGYTYKGKPIDMSSARGGIIRDAKNQIKYCNDSMHGAFDAVSKGMLHRIFLGRLIMNFRQWMPAHYMRRFQTRRYNSILEQDREGFYISTAKFIGNLAKDAAQLKFEWNTRWKQLSDMEKYNLKRFASEAMILAINYALIVLAGNYKDHKNNWARRNLIYQLRRVDLEIGATSFVPLPSSSFFGLLDDNKSYGGKNVFTPFENTLTILNSPFSATNTLNTVVDLVSLGKLNEYYDSGKYKGQNKYLHKIEKDIPLYGKLRYQLIDFLDESSMFEYMNN